ncbi:hypothetical protein RhiirA4_489478 [Rhizophagus irregularis]|uniref:Uncharacterized protein n=1 Tax=Rhizophagus irregularis TaxID=588596 RepID=A0A2I1HUX3_9GLOM|nr:hypothetical protein RhiirA4_489478 [Rhizophagus irregularis]
MKINDAFSTENKELKRKIRASEINDIESKHLSKKAKGKRNIVQISDDDDKDEDVDDDLMDFKSKNHPKSLTKEKQEFVSQKSVNRLKLSTHNSGQII